MNALIGKIWEVAIPDENVPDQFELSRFLLETRGFLTPTEQDAFLNPSREQLHDPMLFRDMELAVEIIRDCLRQKGRILVYGDYDCDGLTATALVIRFLRRLGADCSSMIPNRLEDGYGLNEAAVTEILCAPPDLLITVDCGSSSQKEVRMLMDAGVRVIVSDHHELGRQAAVPLAHLNPHLPGERYPYRHLSGVGVAFKLLQALARKLPSEIFFEEEAQVLCALGTVADSMSLLGENRALVRLGLESFAASAPLGLRRLAAKFRDADDGVDSAFFSFSLAPRLNAAGRMGDTEPALRLLLTENEAEADAAVEELEILNLSRRELEQKIFLEASAQINEMPLADREDILVVADPDWHLGVIGIVSARLSESYQMPCICFGGSGDGLRGSARSYDHFDILAAIAAASEEDMVFGGHAQAAGISLRQEQYGSFARRIREIMRSRGDEPGREIRLSADFRLPHAVIHERSALELRCLAPFGHEMEEPLFVFRGLYLLSWRKVGNGAHLSLQLRLEDGRTIRAIAFKMGAYAELLHVGDLLDLLGALDWHEWNGRGELQIRVQDFRPSAIGQERISSDRALEEAWHSGLSLSEIIRHAGRARDEFQLREDDFSPLYRAICKRLEKEEELLVDLSLLAHALRGNLPRTLPAFALARALDIFQEAGFLQSQRTSAAHWRLKLCPPPKNRPSLREQKTWRRMSEEGGFAHA